MLSLGRNKKIESNKSKTRTTTTISFRINPEDLVLYNKAKGKVNMSLWMRRKLIQDFGNILTPEEIIQKKYDELFSMQKQREIQTIKINYEIDSLVKQINDLKTKHSLQELEVFKINDY